LYGADKIISIEMDEKDDFSLRLCKRLHN
jgi:hypothetical protein